MLYVENQLKIYICTAFIINNNLAFKILLEGGF